ncbi:MAG TPA: acetolactate synthase small subunit [Syntrophales bacterium]|jgi:acetolactate synthase-1/3 small subunit|nr:acetolactate synthase small subunit [Syntrophales bacterium]
MTIEERTLSMLVNNRPGVLSRIAAVFSSRGYNINTLCVAETIDPDVSRITLTSSADSDFTDKIKKQLYKLVDVIEVSDFSGPAFLHRELMIFGVKVAPETRIEIMRAIERFGCRIATMSQNYYILESTGSRAENEAVLAYFDPFGVEEMNRTGSVALKKTAGTDVSLQAS